MFDSMKTLGDLLREKLAEPRSLEIVTPFPSAPDLQEACRLIAANAISALYPWLPSLLNASGAVVLVTPGHLYFSLASSSDWIEIPELDQFINLAACVPPGETVH